MSAGLPEPSACASRISRSRSIRLGGMPSREMASGCAATMCMQSCWPSRSSAARSTASEVRATAAPMRPRPGEYELCT
eukprot:scaffold6931_cov119-Isochrysis_galbana.AAC.9